MSQIHICHTTPNAYSWLKKHCIKHQRRTTTTVEYKDQVSSEWEMDSKSPSVVVDDVPVATKTGTFIFDFTTPVYELLEFTLPDGDGVVEEYVQELRTEGGVSFHFLALRFKHLKQPILQSLRSESTMDFLVHKNLVKKQDNPKGETKRCN